jgi:hypothetical protein
MKAEKMAFRRIKLGLILRGPILIWENKILAEKKNIGFVIYKVLIFVKNKCLVGKGRYCLNSFFKIKKFVFPSNCHNP